MAFTFTDRQSANPNRYKVTTENGESYYVTLERADNPTVEGTPLNAQILNELVGEITGKAASSHKHSATDINSGTLNVARMPVVTVAKGGTGAANKKEAKQNLGIFFGETEPSAWADGDIWLKPI